jgi:hypothetical protein
MGLRVNSSPTTSITSSPWVISQGLPRLTRTALDVGGPCVGVFGGIQEQTHLPELQGRELQEADFLAPYLVENSWHLLCYRLPFTKEVYGHAEATLRLTLFQPPPGSPPPASVAKNVQTPEPGVPPGDASARGGETPPLFAGEAPAPHLVAARKKMYNIPLTTPRGNLELHRD